jgi:hypothetical protein
LKSFTTILGRATRHFGAACKDVDTKELPGEEAAQERREIALAKQGKASKVKTKEKQITTGGKKKTLNLSTFKWQNLGHYPWAICQMGTIDNYSTQIVRVFYMSKLLLTSPLILQNELEH